VSLPDCFGKYSGEKSIERDCLSCSWRANGCMRAECEPTEAIDYQSQVTELTNKLAATELVVEKMREALNTCKWDYVADGTIEDEYQSFNTRLVRDALKLQPSLSALNEARNDFLHQSQITELTNKLATAQAELAEMHTVNQTNAEVEKLQNKRIKELEHDIETWNIYADEREDVIDRIRTEYQYKLERFGNPYLKKILLRCDNYDIALQVVECSPTPDGLYVIVSGADTSALDTLLAAAKQEERER
jgi:hypothetical protein